jgi:hypothetical protein
MRTTALALGTLMMAVPALVGAAKNPATSTSVTGDYVEARTAEVFTGGCIMNSEGETSGREAILAWRVDHGQVDGVPLDGLSVVAVVAADLNLGTHEIGGAEPSHFKTALRVDSRANPAQHDALIAMARSLAPSLIKGVVDVKAVPISFERAKGQVDVSAAEATLQVATHADHSSNCAALQWFTPLSSTDHAHIGTTLLQSWSGTSLGTEWSQGDRRSSFVGSFSLTR